MYRTENEMEHFDFAEAVVDEVRMMNGACYWYLENVKILP